MSLIIRSWGEERSRSRGSRTPRTVRSPSAREGTDCWRRPTSSPSSVMPKSPSSSSPVEDASTSTPTTSKFVTFIFYFLGVIYIYICMYAFIYIYMYVYILQVGSFCRFVRRKTCIDLHKILYYCCVYIDKLVTKISNLIHFYITQIVFTYIYLIME